MPKGMCRLCRLESELKESHFIPSFVGKWVKKTSATGYIRFAHTINRRSQDIAKEYWLCASCEGLFSAWEHKFAEKIFFPFVEGGASKAHYGPWLSRFCASLSWRTLTYMRHLNPSDDVAYNDSLDRQEAALASFLLGQSVQLGVYEQHLFPLEEIAETNATAPANLNRYFLRTMHMDLLQSDRGDLVYTKFPRFIFLGLSGHSQSKQMRESRIALGDGVISPRTYKWPDGFAQYVFSKAEEIQEKYSEISPAQRDRINESLKSNPKRVANSDTISAFNSDLKIFGSKVFQTEGD